MKVQFHYFTCTISSFFLFFHSSVVSAKRPWPGLGFGRCNSQFPPAIFLSHNPLVCVFLLWVFCCESCSPSEEEAPWFIYSYRVACRHVCTHWCLCQNSVSVFQAQRLVDDSALFASQLIRLLSLFLRRQPDKLVVVWTRRSRRKSSKVCICANGIFRERESHKQTFSSCISGLAVSQLATWHQESLQRSGGVARTGEHRDHRHSVQGEILRNIWTLNAPSRLHFVSRLL